MPIKRNVALLSAAVAANTAMLQLIAAVASISLARLLERTRSWERGRLLGFNDLLSGATGAALTLLGGLALGAAGVAALAIGAMALVLAPALWILRTTERRTPCPAQ